MERVRLDMGALSISDLHGGSFVFFLYKKGADKCLPIKVSRSDVNTILLNFKPKNETPTMQMMYCNTLQNFGIELLEITVIRNNGEGEKFLTELLLFDGKKEMRLVCSFGDGIVMAKFFSAPIYVFSDVLDKFATKIKPEGKKVYGESNYMTKLQEAMDEAIMQENYERADELKAELAKLKKERSKPKKS